MNTTRIHTDAVITALEATGFPVGDGKAPAGDPPHFFVVPRPEGDVYGTIDDPHADAELVIQVTSVGTTRKQAEGVRDLARETLLAGLTVSGRTVSLVTIDTVGGVERDPDIEPDRFFCPETYRLFSSPGGS